MSKISTKINLTQLKHAVKSMKAKSGMVDCLIIPIDSNHLVKGEKGIYLDLIGFELKERRDNQTHLVKQSLPKDVYEKMSEQERNDTPIIGSHIVWTQREPDPVTVELSTFDNGNEGYNNDLPF